MAVRLISAAVGIVIGVSVLIIDNIFVDCVVIGFLSAVAVWELTRAIKCDKFPALRWTTVGFAAVYPFIVIVRELKFLAVPLAMVYVIVIALIMLRMHKTVRFEQVLACGSAGGLLPVALSCVVLVRYTTCGEPLGVFMIIYVLFCAWFGDSGAYFVGTFLGKHKLCPGISPKKTVEGLIGGVLTVGILVALTVLICNTFIFTDHHLNYVILVPL
ncbi:MAG: phosphatidate cytidylyltransferase, partial [Oscillospiraceae bacterium]